MTTFKPMLAVNSKPEDLIKPQLGSIKYEGVRGIIIPDDGLIARSLKPHGNSLLSSREDMQRVEQYCCDMGIVLEGEFYVEGWDFSRIDSACRGEGNIDANELKLFVFDCFVPAMPDATFQTRVGFYTHAVTQLREMGLTFLRPVSQVPMQSADDIRDAYVWAIENGYEGFCLKAAQGAYKHGRSTLKQELFTRIKPEDPYDCVVIEIIERQRNLCESELNELGYLKKRQDKDMKRGMGMAQSAWVYTPAINAFHKVSLTRTHKEADLMRIWEDAGYYEGKCMQFVGIPVPGQNVPRSPRFDKWRHDLEPTFLKHSDSEGLLISWDASEIEICVNQGCEDVPFLVFYDLLSNGWGLSVNSVSLDT